MLLAVLARELQRRRAAADELAQLVQVEARVRRRDERPARAQHARDLRERRGRDPARGRASTRRRRRRTHRPRTAAPARPRRSHRSRARARARPSAATGRSRRPLPRSRARSTRRARPSRSRPRGRAAALLRRLRRRAGCARPRACRRPRSPAARRRRRDSSAYSDATSAGSSRRLTAATNGVPGNTARRALAAEPRVDRRADVGELAVLVDPSRGVPPLDVGEQQRVLAAVIGRRRRRVAAVVGGEDQQVVRPQRVEQVGQPAVEVLQAAVEVDRVVAVAPERVRLDEVREDEPVVDRAQQLLGALDAVDVRLRRELLVDVLVREDVADLPDAVDLVARVADEAQVVRAAAARARSRAGSAFARTTPGVAGERPRDHAADRVLARSGSRAPCGMRCTAPRAERSPRARRSGRPSRRSCRRSTCRCADAPRRAPG